MKMPTSRHGGRGRPGRTLLAAGVAALALAACNTSDILQVQDPDIVTPASLSGPIGLTTLYTGAIGDFTLAYSGGTGSGSYADGVATMSSLMSDEGYLSDTFPTRQEFDQRSIDLKNSTLSDAFSVLQRARASLEKAAAGLETGQDAAKDPRVGELWALAGYSYVSFAELYCSGVPFSTANPNGSLTYGQPQTTAQMLTTAIARFDSALAHTAGNDTIRFLALVGKARAQLDAGDFAGAGASAAAVPTGFLYELFHSVKGTVPLDATTSFALENGYYSAQTSQRRISVADDEAGVGLPFRSAKDPRVPVVAAGKGFDSTSPQFDFTTYATNGEVLGRETPFPLATGTEARLIQAEAAQQSGNVAGSLTTLNALRQPLGLAPLTDQGSASANVLQLFQERAFWLYATGHRLGDLRRLVRQYHMPTGSVFPSGPYFKGGSYGADVNYPVPFNEKNNPSFTQCLDRNA